MSAPSIPAPLRGLFWPLGNLYEMASLPLTPSKGFGPTSSIPASSHFAGKPVADTLLDHVGVQLSTIPKLALATFLWWRMSGLLAAASSSYILSSDFIWHVVLRDLIITWCVAGGWDFIVHSHSSPFFARLRGHKLNPIEPTTVGSRNQWVVARWQFAHDAFWSTVSTLISSAFEIALFYHYAQNQPKRAAGSKGGDVGGSTVWTDAGDSWWIQESTGKIALVTLIWLFTMPYWRLAHFYSIHRCMHKWFPGRAPGTGWCPDVGAFLYKHVHALHHLSKNPTSWSGISMHPIESTTYYTAMLIPVLVASFFSLPLVHPIIFLYTKMDLTIAALVGHDGVGYPGAASQPHWLHHALIDVRGGGERIAAMVS